jgi:hypothetical protein
MTTPAADLQTAIARYMARYPNLPLSAVDIAAAVDTTAAQAAAMLARIADGEARPYPIVRAPRGYRWVGDPADVPACVSVLAETIGYITGASPGQAAELAEMVLRSAARPELVHYRWPVVCGEPGGNPIWSGRIDKVTCPACRVGLAPGTEVRRDPR